MSDKELVIKIDEKLYNDIYSDAEIMIYGGMRSGKTLLATLLRAIRNGTPLPKDHGRLIDVDALFDYFGNDAIDEVTRSNIEYFIRESKATIIEAESEK